MSKARATSGTNLYRMRDLSCCWRYTAGSVLSNTEHDQLFRETFQHPENAAGLVKPWLPPGAGGVIAGGGLGAGW